MTHAAVATPSRLDIEDGNDETIVLTVQHPAHVHFFRHVDETLRRHGYDVSVFARGEPIVRCLLERYDVEYEALLDPPEVRGRQALMQARYEWRLLRRARQLDPDVIAAIGGVAAAHVGSVVGARSVVFTDTEHATLSNRLAFPFADTICTPSCYRDDIGRKQVEYDGYHELSYLHPSRFTPNPAVLDELGLAPDDRYVVLRAVDWGAAHDAGESGFDDLVDVVTRLEATGVEVLISAEGPLPPGLAGNRLEVAPHRMHDLLYYADCFVGEGATMAIESAVLGTPAVYVNSLETGVTDELAEDYGLLFLCHGEQRQRTAIDHATEILEGDDEGDWERRRIDLLTDKEDTLPVVLERLGVTS